MIIKIFGLIWQSMKDEIDMAQLMEKWSSSYFLISCKLGPFDCSKGVWEKHLTLWGNCIYFDAHKFLGEEQLSNETESIDPDSLM